MVAIHSMPVSYGWQVVDWVQKHMEEIRQQVIEFRDNKKKNKVMAL